MITENQLKNLTKQELFEVIQMCKNLLEKTDSIISVFFDLNYQFTDNQDDIISINDVYSKYEKYCQDNKLIALQEKIWKKVINSYLTENNAIIIKSKDGKTQVICGIVNLNLE